MKNVLFLLFFCVLAPAAYADDLPCKGSAICGPEYTSANNTWVENMYAMGGVPQNLTTGNYVGRCYIPDWIPPTAVNVKTPASAYLHYNKDRHRYILLARLKTGSDKDDIPPEYFDDGTNMYGQDDEYLNWIGAQKITVRDNSWEERNSIFQFELNTASNLRQTDRFLVLMMRMLVIIPGSNGQQFTDGPTFFYCYFFNRVEKPVTKTCKISWLCDLLP